MPDMLFAFPKVVTRFLGLVKKYPVIVVPFVLSAVADAVILVTLFLAPRPPLSVVLGPIIKAFWGAQYLHYPSNLLLLPELFNYGKNIATFTTGLLLSGVTITMVFQASQETAPEWLFGLSKTLKKFLRLALVWGITFGLSVASTKALEKLAPHFPSMKLFMATEFFATIVIQAVFIFAIPAILIENKKSFIAFLRSLAFFKHYPLTSFLIVLVPSLLVIPLTYAHMKLPFLIDKFAPEAVLWVLSARIVTVTVIDFLVTGMAAMMLVVYREYESAGSRS